MNQNTKNQRDKNVILISNPSDRFNDHDLPNFFSRNSSLGNQFDNLKSGNFNRQSSMGGNLFKTFNKQDKFKQEQPVKVEETLTQAQKYAQQCLEYEKHQFDDRIKLIIHRMSIRAYHNFKDKNECSFLSFFIQKLLCIISKKLLLNRFQLLFLEYVFQETKWKYEIDCINKHSHEYQAYAHSSQADGGSNDVNVTKNLQIYLLYCSFYSKKSLNEFPNENIYNGYLKSLCPKFKDYFQQWTNSSNVSNIKINPKILNNIFKRLTFYSNRQQQQIENYSLLVQQIIDISPAYNAEKGGTKKRNKKTKKQDDYIAQQPSVKQNQSEQIIRQIHPISDLRQQSEDLQSIPNLRNKKQTSYVSNVDGLDPQVYLRGTSHQRMI